MGNSEAKEINKEIKEKNEEVLREEIVRALKKINFCIVSDMSVEPGAFVSRMYYNKNTRDINIEITVEGKPGNPGNYGYVHSRIMPYSKLNPYFIYEFIWYYSISKIKTPPIVYELLYNLPKMYPKIDKNIIKIIMKYYINAIISEKKTHIIQKIRKLEEDASYKNFKNLFGWVFKKNFGFKFDSYEISDNITFIKSKEEFTPLREFFVPGMMKSTTSYNTIIS